MMTFDIFACSASRAFRAFIAGQFHHEMPSQSMTSVGKLVVVSAVVACLVLMALRGGRSLAKVVVGSAGVLFLAGVGYVLVYNVSRFGVRDWESDWQSFAWEDDTWRPPAKPADSRHWTYPANVPPAIPAPVPALAFPPTPAPVVAEVVSGIPLEIAPALPTTTPRPAWVGQPASLQDGVYRIAVSVDPYKPDDPQAQQALTREVAKAFSRYIEADRGPADADRVLYSPGEIRRMFVKETWNELGQSATPAVGTTLTQHALLVFDNAARREIDGRYTAALVSHRLQQAGGLTAALLLVLGTVFGYLKLDTLTRGYYSGRLKVAAGAVLAGAGVLTIYLARSV